MPARLDVFHRWKLLPMALLVFAAPPAPSRAARVDTVVMTNGDKVTCEMKELDRGQLRVKTDGLGTLYVEWDKVARIASPLRWEIHLVDGQKRFGSLQLAAAEGRLVVATAGGPEELALREIVRIIPLHSSFWSRFDGSLEVGGSYTQASRLLQLTPSFSTTYRARSFEAGLDANSTLTRQEGEPESDRSTASLRYTRFRKDRWLGFGRTTAERNTELAIDLRLSFAGGVGRFLVQRTHSRVVVGVGLNATREKPLEGDSSSSLEGLLTAQWQVFRYSFPKTTVNLSASFYPGLSDWGRLRGDVDAELKREIVRDFTVSLRVYESFDTRPPTDAASSNDWSATLSVGWTF
jgi:hypothetical protein